MKMKKFLSALMACAALSASAPAMPATYASQEYTDGTYQSITYRNYGDHIRITGCEDSAAEIAIPAEINGVTVTEIGSSAFSYHSDLTSVTLPNTITLISDYAFFYCDSLVNINLPDSITEIQENAFSNCHSLVSVDIPKNITSISEDLFSGCIALENITIPEGVTSIGENAFNTCRSLRSISIPENVASIGGYAFSTCESLINITLPYSVASIGTSAFYGCTDMKKMIILNPECEILGGKTTITNDYDFIKNVGILYGTIYGYENSTAMTYAEEFSYPFRAFESIGDVNFDGAIDALDASLVLTEYSANATGQDSALSDSALSVADVNFDTAIDALDASAILSFYASNATGGNGTIFDFI